MHIEARIMVFSRPILHLDYITGRHIRLKTVPYGNGGDRFYSVIQPFFLAFLGSVDVPAR